MTDVQLPWLFLSVNLRRIHIKHNQLYASLPPVRAFPDNKHQIQEHGWSLFSIAIQRISVRTELDQRTKTSFGDGKYIPSWGQLPLNGSDSWESVLRRQEADPGSVVHHDMVDQWGLLDEDGCGRCAWLPSMVRATDLHEESLCHLFLIGSSLVGFSQCCAWLCCLK